MFRSVITGTGAYIPPVIQSNKAFANHKFFDKNKKAIESSGEVIVQKFSQITGIEERRYAPADLNTSDIGYLAAIDAIAHSGIDPETLDQIIVAQNFGDVSTNSIQSDAVPSIASRIKHRLGIQNPNCIAYDILFGCPGWIQSMIQADAFFKAGLAHRVLLIGTETLSRVIDAADRDSMIFSDGAGACIMEYLEVPQKGRGILGSCAQSHSLEELHYINMSETYHPESTSTTKYLKMNGRKVYEYAMKAVPLAMKECLEKSGIEIIDLKKIFIHQANEKMDEGIVKRFYQLYNIDEPPVNIMPMCIHWLGNSSVATIPTLYNMVLKGELDNHALREGDVILFASVGAGMNINAVCYRY